MSLDLNLQLTLVEIAERELLEAIHLYFEERDLVSIHTLVKSAQKRLSIILAHELKHELEETALSEVDNCTVLYSEELIELCIADSIELLKSAKKDLFELLAEYKIFLLWFSRRYPDLLLQDAKVPDFGRSLEYKVDYHNLLQVLKGLGSYL